MRARILSLVAIIGSLSGLTIGYAAQNAQAPAQPAQTQAHSDTASTSQTPAAETAGQSKEFKNIQVLKGIPSEQLIPSMQFINGALGVECNFCHVTDKGREGFSLDDKRAKKTAREMMLLTNTINENPAVDKHVTCATCHQGHNQPINNAPVLDAATWQDRADARTRQQQQQRAASGPGTAGAAGNPPAQAAPQQSREERQKAAQAGADAAFQKFLDAVGGQTAVAKVKSMELQGTSSSPRGDTTKYEVIRSGTDKLAYTQTPAQGAGFKLIANGGEAVAVNNGEARAITGYELGALKLDVSILRNIDLKPQYARAQALPFTQKIDGKEVTVVRAQLPSGQGQETLYFDFLSGLLVRRVVMLRTALGSIPQQTDFSDYRDVNGVKIAFVQKVSTTENIQTRTITDARINAPVNDDIFKLPAVEGPHPGGN